MDNFREWLSDNLRYIMLILGVLVVLVGLFFGVRAVSARIAGKRQTESIPMDSVVASVPETAAENALAAASGVSSAAEEVMAAGALAKDAVPEVTELMKAYFDAIGSQNVSGVRSLVDALPEAKAAEISSEKLTYSNVEVYTKPGLNPDSYVVYSSYEYAGGDNDTRLPGILQSYAEKGSDGKYRIIMSEPDAALSSYLTEVAREPDVIELVKKVKDAYTAARDNAGTSGSAASGDTAGGASADDGDYDTGGDYTDDGGDYDGEGDTDDGNYDSEDGSDDYDGGDDNRDEDTDYDADDGEEEYTEEETYEEEEEPETEWTGSASQAVNVRSGPGFDYDVISELKEGQEVTVVGEESGWYHVYADGVEGYVGHSYID